MRETALPLPKPMLSLTVEDADWDAQPVASLRWMMQQMIVIRRFEEALLRLKEQECIHGPVHTSIGQEGVAAGIGCALATGDQVSGTHRAHHQYLAKVLSYCRPDASFDPLAAPLPPRMHEEIRVLLSEIMGLADGCCGGRGGSMHLFHHEAGVAGTNAIVGGGTPHATGVAWAEQRWGREAMAVCCFGDGALYQGVLDESSNLASLWRIPIVYLIENNQYSVGTPIANSCSARELCHKAAAYGMPGLRVDGMDPLAVQLALELVRSRRGDGWLPCYLDVRTYRYLHHAGNQAGSAFGYRRKDEEAAWRARDPLACCEAQLRRRGLIDDAGMAHLESQARVAIDAAIAACTITHAGGRLEVREELWPRTADLAVGLRCAPAPQSPPDVVPAEPARQLRYVEAIAEVTGRWLERDPRVVVFGEEIANMGGGAYGATKGLAARFPDRVLNTPISEAGFSGLACGAAMRGMRPVVEIMFSSFVLVAADQLLNQAGQLGHIYGGHARVPLVVRTRIAAGLGYGAQHSMDPTALFHLFPGWRVVAPSTPADYIGLFNEAMSTDSPTLIIEHHDLYARRGPVPAGPPDERLPFGRARMVRRAESNAVYGCATVVTYSAMVDVATKAANLLAAEGVFADVIDLRCLDAAHLDWTMIGESVRRTGVLVTVEQAQRCNSMHHVLAAGCVEQFFNAMDGPPAGVTALDIPLPVSRRGELACLPTFDQVVDTIRRAALRKIA